MKTPVKLSKSLPSTTTSKIKVAAKTLFAAKGFEAVTVKEIGHKSRSNPALINYHFGGKKELYYAILEEFTAMGRDYARTILRPPSTPKEFIENLDLYIRQILQRFLDDPELYLLLNRECEQMQSKSALHRFEDPLLEVFRMLEEFYTAAQANSILKTNTDPRMVTLMLFCTMGMLCQRDALHEKFIGISLKEPRDLESIAHNLLQLYGHNLLAPQKS